MNLFGGWKGASLHKFVEIFFGGGEDFPSPMFLRNRWREGWCQKKTASTSGESFCRASFGFLF